MTGRDGGAHDPGGRWSAALLVAASAVLFAGVLPLVDSLVPFEVDGDAPGPFVELVPAAPLDTLSTSQTVSLMAADGWRATSTDDADVTLVSGDASLSVHAAAVDSPQDCSRLREGTEARLRQEQRMTEVGDPAVLITADGLSGVVVGVGSGQASGLVFAVCTGRVAVVAKAVGSIGSGQALDEVRRMLSTVRFR